VHSKARSLMMNIIRYHQIYLIVLSVVLHSLYECIVLLMVVL